MMRLKLFYKIFNNLIKIKKETTPLIVGISGIDYAGKTSFTRDFSEFLKNQGYATSSIHVDDFYNGKELNYKGSNMPAYYFRKSYDFKKIVESLLIPLKRNNSLQKTLNIWNEKSNQYDLSLSYSINSHEIVLIEGVFLFQRHIVPFLDYKIHLVIHNDSAKKRAQMRDLHRLSPAEALIEYKQKFVPAHVLYIKEENPFNQIDITIRCEGRYEEL